MVHEQTAEVEATFALLKVFVAIYLKEKYMYSHDQQSTPAKHVKCDTQIRKRATSCI
jgi:hypothetical protein